MNPLVTLEELQSIDVAGLLNDYDSTNIEHAIYLASIEVVSKCGHDFGSFEGDVDMDGFNFIKTLNLRGKSRYPLRTLQGFELWRYDREEEDVIRTVDINTVLPVLFIRETDSTNGETSCLYDRLKLSTGLTTAVPIVRVTGVWGWPGGLPTIVKKAVLSLVVTILNETNVFATGMTPEVSDSNIKRLRKLDGTEIEYFEIFSPFEDDIFAHDRFASSIVKKYIWKKGWEIV